MVTLDWRVDSRDGVALVELTVTNSTGAARRVRIANRLDGAVWPPRREGVPEAGWDDGGFEGVVAPGDRRALGYASPAPTADASAADPPAEIVWTERAGAFERTEESECAGAPERCDHPDSAAVDGSAAESTVVSAGEPSPTVDSTPEDVVRALGDARPPADAVPRPDAGDGSDSNGLSSEGSS